MFYYSYPIHLETDPYLFTYSLITSFLCKQITIHLLLEREKNRKIN